jgi:hypothetical protein
VRRRRRPKGSKAEEIEGLYHLKRRQTPFTVGLAALLCTVAVAPARAQDADPVVRFRLTDVTRLESWSFFEPYAPSLDPTYTLLGNRATMTVSVESRHIDLRGAFQYSQLLGVPDQPTFLSPLGPGPTYFDSAGAPRMYQLYIRAVSMRVKNTRGFSLEAGRMDFASAAEGPQADTAVDRLTRDRLAGRLIGGADWTPFDRAFDGARMDITRTRWRATSALLFPTQGAFEESANPTISALRVVTGTLAVRWPARDVPVSEEARASELQVFGDHYRDRRDVAARPDNTGLDASRADVSIFTIGASHVSVVPWRAGELNAVVWMAGQFGDWYGSDHGAYSVLVEAGFQWRGRWQPHVRAGYLHASGDGDARDNRHATFFPMLPTTPPPLLAGTFAQMNLRQGFANLSVTPSARLTLSATVARLSLAQAADSWYSGTGATAIRGTYFGFSGAPAFAVTGLGTLVQTAVDRTITPHWRFKGELGLMRGGDVIRQRYSGHRLIVFAVESRFVLGG